jgi:hypothetical protein
MDKNADYVRSVGMQWLIDNQSKIQYSRTEDEKTWMVHEKSSGKLLAKGKTLTACLETAAKKMTT